jgi:hypothetical protein
MTRWLATSLSNASQYLQIGCRVSSIGRLGHLSGREVTGRQIFEGFPSSSILLVCISMENSSFLGSPIQLQDGAPYFNGSKSLYRD